ncbi:hypothetical protein [Methanimicrococcus hacksteinii]|uniref:hypothetical protein n=1 Tax=Methanimicrococcus hacksteinii TaxID=3028293 RepID=UPI00298EDB4F|nr:hypothetical protein [Methanimicrococcus sp. At1]
MILVVQKINKNRRIIKGGVKGKDRNRRDKTKYFKSFASFLHHLKSNEAILTQTRNFSNKQSKEVQISEIT